MSDVMTAAVTVDEFLALADGRPPELVRGEIREMTPAFEPAMTVAANLIAWRIAHVHPRRLGRVYMENGAFVRAERLPVGGVRSDPIRFAPDLAVEVLSPSDTASTRQETLADHREVGTPLFWAVDPETRSVAVYPLDAPRYTLREGATLTGDRVLPDARCHVDELFEGIGRA